MRAVAIFSSVCVLVLFGGGLCKNVKRSMPPPGLLAHGGGCENVRSFFVAWNITVNEDSPKGSVCNGHCCDDKAEALLRKRGQRDFADLLEHNSRTLQGVLKYTADILQNHVLELTSQSENKTLFVFSQVYQGMEILSRQPITTLYQEIRTYLTSNLSRNDLDLPQLNIKNSVMQFFTDLFPLAYLRNADTQKNDFTVQYKHCIKGAMDRVLPFGDIPKLISTALAKSLEATRFLLQSLAIGSKVLNTTDSLLENSTPECHQALFRMTYCPKCQGLTHNTKPCSGYCLNVVRGCIRRYVAELENPWNGYVESVERLVNAIKRNNNDAGVNVDLVIRNLDNQISTAIMHSMEKMTEIDSKVKRECGHAQFSKKEDPLMAQITTPLPTASGKPSRLPVTKNFSPLPDQHLIRFLNAISKARSFYGNLADNLCQDESFAERKDKQCWNGERIAEYSKAILDVGPDHQKYNPEVKLSEDEHKTDPLVQDLADKLRRVHQSAMKYMGPSMDDAMQQDGVDGSGQGSGQEPDLEDDDDERSNGSGSGDHPTSVPDFREEVDIARKNDEPTVVRASSASTLSAATILLVCGLLAALRP